MEIQPLDHVVVLREHDAEWIHFQFRLSYAIEFKQFHPSLPTANKKTIIKEPTPINEKMYHITPEDEKKLTKLGPYQQAILRILAEVPKGKVTTYGDLAKELARRDPRWSPHASRAVGTTMRNNPCGPQIPCHRVIRSDGNIGNFRGGAEGAVEEKTMMLREEGVTVTDGRIDLKKHRHRFK